MRALSIAFFATVAASPAALADSQIVKAYTLLDLRAIITDAACTNVLRDEMMPDYNGLNQISLPNYFGFQARNGYIVVYPQAEYRSARGTVSGTATCVFDLNGTIVTDIILTFEEGMDSRKRGRLERAMNLPPYSTTSSHKRIDP